MALIVEDGSIVAGANTWVSRADYIAYAATLGVTIADVDASDVHLIKAREFIEQHEDNLKGSLIERGQPTAYPRNWLVIDGWSWSGSEIPTKVPLCQMAFALDVNAGVDLWNVPINPSIIAKRERVEGAVEVEYAIEGGTGQNPMRTSTGDSFLSSLLNKSSMFSMEIQRR